MSDEQRIRLQYAFRSQRQAIAVKLAPWLRFNTKDAMGAWELSQQRALRILDLEDDVARLRRQNHEHAHRRDLEMADLQSEVVWLRAVIDALPRQPPSAWLPVLTTDRMDLR